MAEKKQKKQETKKTQFFAGQLVKDEEGREFIIRRIHPDGKMLLQQRIKPLGFIYNQEPKEYVLIGSGSKFDFKPGDIVIHSETQESYWVLDRMDGPNFAVVPLKDISAAPIKMHADDVRKLETGDDLFLNWAIGQTSDSTTRHNHENDFVAEVSKIETELYTQAIAKYLEKRNESE